jgi:hypothetical protein
MKFELLCLFIVVCAIIVSGCIEYVPDNQLLPTPIVPVENKTDINPLATIMTTLPTIIPTPTIDPFPYALKVGGKFLFGSEEVRSIATIYRYKLLDNYTYHNDELNINLPQNPPAGKKYLFVFLNIENIGKTRVFNPTLNAITVLSKGEIFAIDPDRNPDLWIVELQTSKKLNNGESVRDFGIKEKNMIESEFVYPGTSNAIDGYLIYVVPKDLNPQETIVSIAFNGYDNGYWVLR